MDYLLVVLQGLIGGMCFIMPGMALLSLLCRHRIPEWPFALILAVCYTLSSTFIAGLQLLSLTLLNPMVSHLVAWIFVLGILFYTGQTGWKKVLACFTHLGIGERRTLLLVVATVSVWLLTMPLSAYPSHISLDLGDPPVYYRTAANLTAGRGWVTEYFAGDYVKGALPYIATQPILTLITTFLFHIFGVNWYSLYIYSAIAGGALIYLLVSFVCLCPNAPSPDARCTLFLTVVFILLPTHFLLFGLGVITAPGALVFFTVVVSCVTRLAPAVPRYLIVVIALIFLLWVRPEASLLAMLFMMCYGIPKLLTIQKMRSQPIRSLLLVVCLMAPIGLWVFLPAVMKTFSSSALSGLALFYLQFDGARGDFVPLYPSWPNLNRQISKANFLNETAVRELQNPSIGSELRTHPAAFLQYLITKLPETAALLVRAITYPHPTNPYALSTLLTMFILSMLLALSFIDASNRLIVVVIGSFLLFIPILNFGVSVRHILMVSPVILGLSLRLVWRQCGRGFSHLLSAVLRRQWLVRLSIGLVASLFVLDSLWLIKIRTARANQSYTSILADIAHWTSPSDVIASSYPQLITCMTGRRSVGATWLIENIEGIVRKYKPDFILVDNARQDGPDNYALLDKRGWTILGYVPLVHNAAQRYILFRSLYYDIQRPKTRELTPAAASKNRTEDYH